MTTYPQLNPATRRRRARALFRGTFGDSTNFMTPEAVDYGISGDYVWEMSRGTGIWNESIYGVTVLEVDGTRTTLGACFDTPEEAWGYIGELAG